MTLRLIPDDDDSLAANQEPPDLDQRRRGRGDKGEGYWRPEWVAGRHAAAVTPSKVCRECREQATVLHQDPRTTHPGRVICGVCQGRANRERMGTVGGGR